MTRPAYDKELTALLIVDPYNDFISEGGKLWGRIRAVAEANNCVPHMLQVLNAARKAKNFAEADRIREELAAMRVVVKDTNEGTTWEIAR